ncbi:MAG TPA: NAD+ synthase [bacterium]|nr:NAD+ synthase [bacterium]
MKITLAQLNPTIADFPGNLKKAEAAVHRARSDGSDLVVFPELFLTGYPPRDLLERHDFVSEADRALGRLIEISARFPEPGILMGTIQPTQKGTSHLLYNSALLIRDGQILFRQHKSLLPTYDVFDEARYFEPAGAIRVYEYAGEKLGVTLCEDAWNDTGILPGRAYGLDPVEALARNGATLLVNLSASPFHAGKETVRYRLLRNHATRHRVPFVLVNQVGGNDELLFDGRSLILDPDGRLLADLPSFEETVRTIRLDAPPVADVFHPRDPVGSVHDALVLGVSDYCVKCGFGKVLLGLSGGIDSAVVAAIAARALGPENVTGVAMPSVFTSAESNEDAAKLAANLGIRFRIIPIEPLRTAMLDLLSPEFEGLPEDTTEENIQARIRGNILMALSNKFGALTLSTGNKSELSMGYCTLYGDMSGGLGVISDVPKTLVYDLARFINRETEHIPRRILERPPSAELKPDQKDEDTLPPYPVLDRILELYLDEGKSEEEIVAAGLDAETVRRIIDTVRRNEYKRRQAPPGLKVTSKAFGMGRRMPVAAKFRAD